MTDVLGSKMTIGAWALSGILPPEDMAQVLQRAVAAMGMTTDGMGPVVKQYPLPSGRGGLGHTLFLPFAEETVGHGWWGRLKLRLARLLLGRQLFASVVFQPLVESFIVSDDYPELGRTYVVAASCKPFDMRPVTRLLAFRVGPLLDAVRIEL